METKGKDPWDKSGIGAARGDMKIVLGVVGQTACLVSLDMQMDHSCSARRYLQSGWLGPRTSGALERAASGTSTSHMEKSYPDTSRKRQPASAHRCTSEGSGCGKGGSRGGGDGAGRSAFPFPQSFQRQKNNLSNNQRKGVLLLLKSPFQPFKLLMLLLLQPFKLLMLLLLLLFQEPPQADHRGRKLLFQVLHSPLQPCALPSPRRRHGGTAAGGTP